MFIDVDIEVDMGLNLIQDIIFNVRMSAIVYMSVDVDVDVGVIANVGVDVGVNVNVDVDVSVI